MGLEGTEGEGRGQYEKGGREGEQELKGEGIEREERKGKGLGGEGRGEQGKERKGREKKGWSWKGKGGKGGLKKERTSRDHRASELLYSSRVNAIYA